MGKLFNTMSSKGTVAFNHSGYQYPHPVNCAIEIRKYIGQQLTLSTVVESNPHYNLLEKSMKLRLITLLCLVLLFQPAFTAFSDSGNISGKVDGFLEEQFSRVRSPGMALAVVDHEGFVYSRGFGQARSSSLFYTASLSKSVTATAVLLLVQDGLLDLDTPVQSYLPEFTAADPELSADITVRHLLNQTSGLSDAGYRASSNPGPSSLEEIAADLGSARFASIPGETFHYFNANYQLLGLLVEKVSGDSFEGYIKEHIFEPLGMSSSCYTDRLDVLKGYNLMFGVPVHLMETRRPWSPSGGVISTAEDMARLVQMYLNKGRPLLEADLAELALTPPLYAETDDHLHGYGMGWYTAEYNSIHYLTHGGDINSFHGDMALLPDAGFGIVILYNSNNLIANFTGYPAVMNGLVSILSGEQAQSSAVSMRLVGLVILFWLLWTLYSGIRKLTRVKTWAAEAVQWRFLRRFVALGTSLLPALVLIFLPQLVLLVSGRSASHILLFSYLPDVLVLLSAAAVLSILHFACRLRALSMIRN